MTSLTKYPQPPNQKILFRVRTRRLADPFKPLHSSLVQLAEKLWHWLGNQNCWFWAEIQERYIRRPVIKVLSEMKHTVFQFHYT